MKKIILFVAVLSFVTMTASAQNGWFVGGSISGEFSKVKLELDGTSGDTKTSTFSIVPSINKMFGNWSVGLGLGYEHTKYDDQDKEGQFVLIPNVTYYLKIADKFYYTPGLNVGVGFGTYKYDDDIADDDIFSFSAAIKPLSFEFRPTECIGINFAAGSIGYGMKQYKEGDYKETYSDFFFGLNTGATVTFKFFF